ncbi:MAG: IS1595 family transposase [Chloroflexi bacterium]|nr:IS1595 family transposase [Chloroflexota bacterium]
MVTSAPGKAHREGISLIELYQLFPNDEQAREWFEALVWPNGRACPHCGSVTTREVPNAKPMPYWCTDCRDYFSVKTGTAMQSSKLGYQKWAMAIYLEVTSLKGVSSMKLHRDLKISQKAAWFMLHRIREAFTDEGGPFAGPVEVDEMYVGGREANKPEHKRGQDAKMAVVGAKDRATGQVRAEAIGTAHGDTLRAFVRKHAAPGAAVYSDGHGAYTLLDGEYDHKAVAHSVGTYVIGDTRSNGIESFWSMFRRGYHGTYHKISPKHLNRYVQQFAGKHNLRESDTLAQMAHVAAGLVGRRLLYRGLVADNGLASGTRSA